MTSLRVGWEGGSVRREREEMNISERCCKEMRWERRANPSKERGDGALGVKKKEECYEKKRRENESNIDEEEEKKGEVIRAMKSGGLGQTGVGPHLNVISTQQDTSSPETQQSDHTGGLTGPTVSLLLDTSKASRAEELTDWLDGWSMNDWRLKV